MSTSSTKTKMPKYMAEFSCDSTMCEQNCCEIYTIWVDEETAVYYKENVPKLYNLLTKRDDGRYIIPSLDDGCVFLEKGKCQIHANLGSKHLPEVCYSYPRNFYSVNGEIFVTPKLLCDHILTVMLDCEDAFSWVEKEVERVTSSCEVVPDSKFAGITADSVLCIFNSLSEIIDDEHYNSEETMIRLVAIANLLSKTKPINWQSNSKCYLDETNKDFVAGVYKRFGVLNSNYFNTLFLALLSTTEGDRSEKLSKIFDTIFSFFNSNNPASYKQQFAIVQRETRLDEILKKYTKAKLAEYFYPVADWADVSEDIMIIAVNYLIVKMALVFNSDKIDLNNNVEVARLIAVVEPCFFIKRSQVYKYLHQSGLMDQNKIINLLINY